MKSKNRNNDSSDSSNAGQELDWLAFCYIADELDADAKAEFEERLRTDVQTCEAVAEAAQLSSLVRESCEEPQVLELAEVGTTSNDVGNNSSGWSIAPVLVFAASVLLCLFAASWIWNGGNSASDASFELASTWADSLTEDSTENSNEPVNDGEPSIVLSSAEVDASSDPEGDSSWLLVALAEEMDGGQ